jgi:predicted amidohydrolase YtcJ
MMADLIVLTADPFKVAPAQIHALRVTRTIMAGKTVFRAQP